MTRLAIVAGCWLGLDFGQMTENRTGIGAGNGADAVATMHWLLVYSYILIVSFGLALFLTPLFKRLSFRWGFIDHPDTKRKFHPGAMPLLGGCAVFGAFALNVLFNYLMVLPLSSAIDLPFIQMPDIRHHIEGAFTVWRKLVVLLFGGFLMIALGMYDDKHELKPRAKLLAQFFVATIVWLAGMRIMLFVHQFPAISYVVTVLWIVTITNAMNFLDNMDGLCAGIGVVAAGLFAFIAGIQQQYFVCLLSLALVGALLGFLLHNFKPASIFLGDAGSHFIGYMLAVLPVIGTFYRGGDKPTWLPVLIPLLVLAVPLFDLVMVSWMRLRNRQPIYMGDVNHISHRLVRVGLPQSWAVMLIYLIALTLGLGATILLWAPWTAALIVILQTVCVLAVVTLLERLGRK